MGYLILKISWVYDFLSTKINTMEMLTAHVQHMKIYDLMQVYMQKRKI